MTDIIQAPLSGAPGRSGLQDRGHALAAGGADGDQRPNGPAALLLGVLCLFLFKELFGGLRQDPPAGGGEGVAGGPRRPVDVDLGPTDGSVGGGELRAVIVASPFFPPETGRSVASFSALASGRRLSSR